MSIKDDNFDIDDFNVDVDVILDDLSRQQAETLIDILGKIADKYKYNAINQFFPDTGPLRRELYPKHLQCFEKGQEYGQRCFIAGNRVGKSLLGGCETVFHATGLYPKWWRGKRFSRPTRIWCAGNTNETTRDILQTILLGPVNDMGSGLIPKSALFDEKGRARVTTRSGIPGAKQDIYVKHISGGFSQITLKSFEQRREGFEGTTIDFVWLDEQVPHDILSECITRTMTCQGLTLLTFTPLKGLSDAVLQFLPNGQFPNTPNKCGPVVNPDNPDDTDKWVTTCEWGDVPHLTESAKKKMLASYMPHEREAREKGIPVAGVGKIYPVPESEITVTPFKIPDYWPRVYGMDVGYKCTAAVFAAYDEQNDTIYIYHEYKGEYKNPLENAGAINAHCFGYIPGVVDPAANALSHTKGNIKYLEEYRSMGLEIYLANNAVSAGILNVYHRLSSGRLKVFSTCCQWFNEYRIYSYEDNGRPRKQRDDLMDSTRYLCMSGLPFARCRPDPDDEDPDAKMKKFWSRHSRNSITGY